MARNNDFLSGSGMSAEEQHAAVMRAAADSLSTLEGEYDNPPGTYNSPMAKLLQRKTWESRMRKEMGDGSDYVI